jgi:hypothetical protein
LNAALAGAFVPIGLLEPIGVLTLLGGEIELEALQCVPSVRDQFVIEFIA